MGATRAAAGAGGPGRGRISGGDYAAQRAANAEAPRIRNLGRRIFALFASHRAAIVTTIVLVLIGAVWLGMRRREPPLPPGEHPRSGAWQTRQEHDVGAPPDHGPGHQGDGARTHESRLTEPEVMPTDGRRRFPHEVHDSGVHAGRVPSHPRRHSGPNVD